MLHRTLGETVGVETAPGRRHSEREVDANQLENAILNLAINARDAMPGGGRLKISTDVAELDAASRRSTRGRRPATTSASA